MIRLGLINLNQVYTLGIKTILQDYPEIQFQYSICFTHINFDLLDTSPQVDVLLVHLTGQEATSTFQFCNDLLLYLPNTRILVFTHNPDITYVQEAFAHGVSGYLSINDSPHTIIDAIRSVAEGKQYLSPTITPNLVELLKRSPNKQPVPDQALSPRELDIYTKLGQGISAKEIALEANRSQNTINTHINRMKQKLNITSTADMYYQAYQWVSKRYIPGSNTHETAPPSNLLIRSAQNNLDSMESSGRLNDSNKSKKTQDPDGDRVNL